VYVTDIDRVTDGYATSKFTRPINVNYTVFTRSYALNTRLLVVLYTSLIRNAVDAAVYHVENAYATCKTRVKNTVKYSHRRPWQLFYDRLRVKDE
jgi:hypothetical protein